MGGYEKSLSVTRVVLFPFLVGDIRGVEISFLSLGVSLVGLLGC